MSDNGKPADPGAPMGDPGAPMGYPAAPPPYAPPKGQSSTSGAPLPYPSAPGPGFNPSVYPPSMPPQAAGGQGMAYAPSGAMSAVPPAPQTITVTTHQTPPTATMVALLDQCPNCKMGNLHEQYTPAGLCCAILFFPIGIICCMMSRHKVCPVCGTAFFGR